MKQPSNLPPGVTDKMIEDQQESPDEQALKPCPCCGASPRLVDLAGYEILCNCGLSFCGDNPGKEETVAGWNRRAEWMAQQEPVAYFFRGFFYTAKEYFNIPSSQQNEAEPLYAAPVAKPAAQSVSDDPARCHACGRSFYDDEPAAQDCVSVPREPTVAMIEAYLLANATYWVEHDKLPSPIGKWRSGTAKQATVAGYKAMLAAHKEPTK